MLNASLRSDNVEGFLRLLELLRKIQHSAGVAVRIQQDPNKQQTTILTFRTKNIEPETVEDIAEVRRLLRLDPEAQEFKMVFASTPANDREVAVLTRSLIQIMGMIAAHVEVPTEDIAQGRATPGLGAAATLKIGCARRRPADSFAAVSYRDHWFWIDDRDLPSKGMFSFLMFLFTLTESGGGQVSPVLTVPAG